MRVVGSVGFSSAAGAGLGVLRSLIVTGGVAVAAFLGLATSCYSPSPAPGLPCTADRECPDGQVCSLNEVCVASGSLHAIHDNDADDFGEPGTLFEGTIVTRRGTVESASWMNHGMRITSLARASFEDPTTASWSELAAEEPTGQGYVYSSTVGWSDTGKPPGLGLSKGTDVTVLLEGEIYLDAGTWKLELRCDDAGFVDLAEPGSTAFRRFLTTTLSNVASDSIDAKVAGWYPVRMASVNRALAGNISLRGTSSAANAVAFDAARVRAAVPADATGLVVDSFDSPALLHFRSAMLSGDIDNLAYGDDPPPDSGISTATAYSVRWSGQFLLEQELRGFTISSEGGGHRVWIDGELRADKLLSNSASSTLLGLALAPGWHDVVIDLEKRASGSTALRLSELDGDLEAFDVENLRPVVSPAQRWMSARNTTQTAIPNPGSLGRSLSFPAIAGTVTDATAELTIDHSDHSELALSARSGTITRILAAAGSLTGTGFLRQRYALSPRDYNLSPGGSLVLTAADTVAMVGAGDLLELSASMSYTDTSASAAPFPQAATYISSPRDLEDVVAFGKASWKLRNDRGVTVEVSVRTGATEEECATAAWQAVDADGLVTAAPSRFVQYRVVMRTSGLFAAELESFTLEYYSKE